MDRQTFSNSTPYTPQRRRPVPPNAVQQAQYQGQSAEDPTYHGEAPNYQQPSPPRCGVFSSRPYPPPPRWQNGGPAPYSLGGRNDQYPHQYQDQYTLHAPQYSPQGQGPQGRYAAQPFPQS